MQTRLPAAHLQGFRFSAGDLVVVNLGTDLAATTRYAIVEELDGHSDALTIVDVTGRELNGSIVSARLMTDDEVAEWNNYPDGPNCTGCHRQRVLVVEADEGGFCSDCAMALVVFAGSEAA